MTTDSASSMLDGSSHSSAITSVAALLGLQVDVYRGALRATRMPEAWVDVDACFDAVVESLARVAPDIASRVAALPATFQCAWFHASRVVDPESFRRRGILPLEEMRAELDGFLESLMEGLETDGGDGGVGLSYAAKQDCPFDVGPHAFLLRSAAVLAPGATHQYMRTPEYVEDFAGERLGGNRGQLELRFRKATTPCLVKFQGTAGRRALQCMVLFGLVIEQGHPEAEAAAVATWCMAPDGEAIASGRIIAVETFPQDAFDERDDAGSGRD